MKRQELEELLQEIKQVKSEAYTGTATAWGYLKEKPQMMPTVREITEMTKNAPS